jgi:hypothetical protein
MNRPFTLSSFCEAFSPTLFCEGFTQSVLCEGPTIRQWPLRFPRRPSTLVLRIFTLRIEGRAVTLAARVRRFLSRPAPLLTPSNLCAFPRHLREQSLGPPKLPSCKPPTPACPEARTEFPEDRSEVYMPWQTCLPWPGSAFCLLLSPSPKPLSPISFRINTYEFSTTVCIQRAFANTKRFTINTYKNRGGRGVGEKVPYE